MHHEIFEIPIELTLERWKLPSITSHGLKTGPSCDRSENESMVKNLCTHIMCIGQESQNDIESTVNVFNHYLLGRTNRNAYDLYNGEPLINSISRFDLKFSMIRIPVLALVKTKGCGHEGKPPKSSERFRST